MACCPAHDDHNPSLSITELSDGRILMKCWAGCEVTSVVSALGLRMCDLMPNPEIGSQYKQFIQYRSLAPKQSDKLATEKMILQIAKQDRANGKRLSKADLEREKQAYLRVRHAESH